VAGYAGTFCKYKKKQAQKDERKIIFSAIGIFFIFWRKIVIFHTKYPKNVRASLHSAQFFNLRPPS
jgi:hypothetical protein